MEKENVTMFIPIFTAKCSTSEKMQFIYNLTSATQIQLHIDLQMENSNRYVSYLL